MSRGRKDKLLELLRDTVGVEVSEDGLNLTCLTCLHTIGINDANFVRKTSKHFNAGSHKEKSYWYLNDCEGQYSVVHLSKPPMSRSLLGYFSQQNQLADDNAGTSLGDNIVPQSELHAVHNTLNVGTQTFPVSSPERRSTSCQTQPPSYEGPDQILLTILGLHSADRASLLAIKQYPFVMKVLQNIVKRGNCEDLESNKRPHDPTIKATISKFALKFSTAAAQQFSELIGGPKRSTICNDIASKHHVLPFLDKENLSIHVRTAKGNVSGPFLIFLLQISKC